MVNEKKENLASEYLPFNPDYAVPPGDTLLETIEYFGMSQAELAERTGRPSKTINEIIKGKTAITPATALQFERVLGVSARLWNNLERNYREALARQEERIQLETHLEWLKLVPVSIMVKYKWVKQHKDKIEQLKEVLNFFAIASPDAWHEVWGQFAVSYRKSSAFQSNPMAVSVWLRKGEIEAQKIDCKPFDKYRFKRTLNDIRILTNEPPNVFIQEIKRKCSDAGVAVVFARDMPGCPVSGATRWLNPNKALIQLSLRYKTDDHLWFTFFHEAGHILLHGKREVFLESDNKRDEKEEEADHFASEILIPSSSLSDYLKHNTFSAISVQRFASHIGIAPGIVVGRLQYLGKLPYSHLNKLKRRFEWLN